MFKALLVIASMFLVAGVNTANAVSLPPVNTNIVNANQAQFIGSMITSQTNSSASSVIRQAVTPLNPQFKDCEACNAWVESLTTTSPGLIARFVGEGNGVGKNLLRTGKSTVTWAISVDAATSPPATLAQHLNKHHQSLTMKLLGYVG